MEFLNAWIIVRRFLFSEYLLSSIKKLFLPLSYLIPMDLKTVRQLRKCLLRLYSLQGAIATATSRHAKFAKFRLTSISTHFRITPIIFVGKSKLFEPPCTVRTINVCGKVLACKIVKLGGYVPVRWLCVRRIIRWPLLKGYCCSWRLLA